ncbi:MAG: hypothetical protein ACI8ZM_005246 [Crocinitomix sp.]|jgi:uncharacterized protein (TIGR00290 family)
MSKQLKTYFNWSTGKDCALAYYHLQKDDNFKVDLFLTTINSHHNRVSMHGLRRELLISQTNAIGLPLHTVELPEEPSMEEYNKIMLQTVDKLKADGYTDCGFGDIFLEDLRKYREEQLLEHGIKCHFPIWKVDTKKVIQEFIALGFKAIVICIKSDLLDESFIGREIDADFVRDLPDNVDPCGENGEFHTFCYDGPIFNHSVKFTLGEKVFRAYQNPQKDEQHNNESTIGFWFCDLLPV